MARVLVLTGGPDHAHDFLRTGASLAGLIGTVGHHVEVLDDPDAAAGRLDEGDVDALVVNALRWRMEGEAYEPWREAWAYQTPDSTRRSISGFVTAGGGLFGNHTASICFDDWSGWRDVLGGSWRWGRSSHPAYGPVSATLHGSHPVIDGLPGELHVIDEVYGDLDLAPGIEVLATARRTPDDLPQPVLWAHQHGQGRVVYDGFGHDAASLEHPDHARLIRRAVAWVAHDGRSD